MRDNTEERARGPWNEGERENWGGPWNHGHHGPRGPQGQPGQRGPQGPHGFEGWGRHRGGRGGPWGGFFGGEGGENWGGFFGAFGGPGGGRERLERGLLRYIILSVLQDGPKHGYEIIKQLEERTFGHYSPSPGTLYPTLQYLEDLGLVRSDQEADRRVYSITDAGRAELKKQADIVQGFWGRFQNRGGSGAAQYEMKFAGDAFRDLVRTVMSGLRSGTLRNDPEAVRKVRGVLERCQNEIRDILSQAASERPATEGSTGQAQQEAEQSGESNTGAGTVQF